jgi:hypothetical protein
LEVINGEIKVVCDKIGINELFRCGNKNASSLFFHFETKFEPYQKYCTDSLDGIDLVVKDLDGNYLAPVEVKLTVLPSSGTSVKPQSEWGRVSNNGGFSSIAMASQAGKTPAFPIFPDLRFQSAAMPIHCRRLHGASIGFIIEMAGMAQKRPLASQRPECRCRHPNNACHYSAFPSFPSRETDGKNASLQKKRRIDIH